MWLVRRKALFNPGVVLLILVALVSGSLAAFPVASAAQFQLSPTAPAPRPLTWQDTGQTLAPGPQWCFDAVRPGSLLVNQFDPASDEIAKYGPVGFYSLNLATGQKIQLNNYSEKFYCNENNGQVYNLGNPDEPRVVFSSSDPVGKPLGNDNIPTNYASDGTARVYYLSNRSGQPSSIDYSEDGGVTYQNQPLSFAAQALAVARTDSRSLYAFSSDSLYFSSDSGLTWQKRFTGQFGYPRSIGGSVNTVVLDRTPSKMTNEVYLSIDGGQNFILAGAGNDSNPARLFQTSTGIIRAFGTELTLTLDGGQTWQDLKLPFTSFSGFSLGFKQAAAAPDNLFATDQDGTIWYSPDAATTWQKLDGFKVARYTADFYITPYVPLTLVGTSYDASSSSTKLYTLTLGDAGKYETKVVGNYHIPGGISFMETGHNLSGVFKTYWEQHGGLAQFGYPWTEPFREINSSDGKAYVVQYFERNRFEYHPEFTGTPYEVELGLLGNQLTQERRAAGEGAFNHFADMHYPGGTYFPEVGHNLRNSFKNYWEQNGSLAVYGYPISEEFEEVNPDDGRTYVVQYFERARFEYHPEFKGTKSEVLLGLLGNSLLRQKGWL